MTTLIYRFTLAIKKGRLRWLEHGACNDDTESITRCTTMQT